MAAATVNSSYVSTYLNGLTTQKCAYGITPAYFSVTIATTSLDDATDRVRLVPLFGARGGRTRAFQLIYECADLDTHATPTLAAGLFINHNGADTAVVANGTAFQAAQTPTIKMFDIVLDDSSNDGIATLDFVVGTAAATAASGVIKGVLFYI